MKGNWRYARAPPSALIAYLMGVFCAHCILIHDNGFDWPISHLASDRLEVSAECPYKWHFLMLIFAYIVLCESREHFWTPIYVPRILLLPFTLAHVEHMI
jgi:hypothetical protein